MMNEPALAPLHKIHELDVVFHALAVKSSLLSFSTERVKS